MITISTRQATRRAPLLPGNRILSGGYGEHVHQFQTDSFKSLLDSQFLRLGDRNLKGDQVYAILLEIGEEFRHILYHIQDPQFYSYLREERADRLGAVAKDQ